MNQTRRAVGVLLGLVLVTAGCNSPGDDNAAPTPTATAVATQTPSPTPSPTPTKEPEPEPGPDFEHTDERGAETAAKYFIDVVLYTIRTGDETALDSIQLDDSCKFCAGVREVARDRHNEAAVVTGGVGTVETLQIYSFDEAAGGYPLDIRVTESDSVLLDSEGNIIREIEGETHDLRVEIIRSGSTWRLLNILRTQDIR